MDLYQIILYFIIFIVFSLMFYIGSGGRAWFGTQEKPKKIIGKTVQLREIECAPNGLLPKSKKIPPMVVPEFINLKYRLEFLEPFELNGKIESFAYIQSRYKGYPISNIKKRGTLVVTGNFESGETFIAQINLV